MTTTLTSRQFYHLHRASENVRADAVLAALNKFGAAAVLDVTAELRMNHVTVRRLLGRLIESKRAVLIQPTARCASALYGPAEPDDAPEFDLMHATVPAVQLGLGRDPLVAALFGARPAQGVHS